MRRLPPRDGGDGSEFVSFMMVVVLVFALISLISGCSNVPYQQPDICYGLQGEAFQDCILRHRPLDPGDMGRKG